MLTVYCNKIKIKHTFKHNILESIDTTQEEINDKAINVPEFNKPIPKQISDDANMIPNIVKYEILSKFKTFPEVLSHQFTTVMLKDLIGNTIENNGYIAYKGLQIICSVKNISSDIIQLIDNMTLEFDAVLLLKPLFSTCYYIITLCNNKLETHETLTMTNALEIKSFISTSNNLQSINLSKTFIDDYVNSLV